jgi:hypothetical protein
MSLGERDAFHLALKELAGEVKDSEVMHGGDLSALPVSKEQQEIPPKESSSVSPSPTSKRKS